MAIAIQINPKPFERSYKNVQNDKSFESVTIVVMKLYSAKTNFKKGVHQQQQWRQKSSKGCTAQTKHSILSNRPF